jgi:hypothetical protein
MTTRKRNKRAINYGNAKIEFTHTRPSFFMGFSRVIYQQHEIFVADKEKALIDALAMKRMSLPECIEIVKNNKRRMNSTKLFYYAKQIRWLCPRLKRELHD